MGVLARSLVADTDEKGVSPGKVSLAMFDAKLEVDVVGEQARLEALHRLNVLDTEAEDRFDRLVDLAALTLRMPIALVSLVDKHRQWFKARVGTTLSESAREKSFCSYAIASPDPGPFIVRDTFADVRFAKNPMVTGAPHVRFYAGHVVRDVDGYPLGTLCVIDHCPRDLDESQRRVLAQLAVMVEEELSRLTQNTTLVEEHFDRRMLHATMKAAAVGLAIVGTDRKLLRCNEMFADQVGRTVDELQGVDILDLVHTSERSVADAHIAATILDWTTQDSFERKLSHPDGRLVTVDVKVSLLDHPDPLIVLRTVDITDRLRLMDELAEYRYFFDHSIDMIIVLDDHLNVRRASPSLGRTLGIDVTASGLAANLRRLVHPEDKAHFTEQLARLRSMAQVPSVFTLRIFDTSGGCHHLEFVVMNLLHEPAVCGFALAARDVTERVLLAERLTYQADHDSLSGLPNRVVFDRTLQDHLDRASNGGHRFAVVYVDLDRFKDINDNFGHHAGDDVLSIVGQTLANNVRDTDLAARIGGDEFGVILDPVLDDIDAHDIASRLTTTVSSVIRHHIRTRHRYESPASQRSPGASCGVAVYRSGDTISTIRQRADKALYEMKDFTHSRSNN